ncbi:hypothetical protein BO82DRAFT_384071 [Aspergillus uvarum CBS 121591]|uniref:Pentatricopeptide repeat domain-containing protein n=1 Tax=Aspergillus uvarum CBS 121591 TaxID=1448315 RepID=A0A319C4P9_9EURO|nr:hypothetical protein BO82DRAFT_384071 [Aspergillus uvarum CBS 121591]PYH80836.1 hypothetical protein BO82DRAFT_384071 [Aspergillus uvarum CBS 121591]
MAQQAGLPQKSSFRGIQGANEEDGQIYRSPLFLFVSRLMRPALLRLLKRPSALSVLDSLISAPVGVEQLELRRDQRCLRCLSRSTRREHHVSTVNPEQTSCSESLSPSTRRKLSFQVHKIKAPKAQAEDSIEHGESSPDKQEYLSRIRLQTEKLEFESDIGHARDIGTRLVDDPRHRNDFRLWVELLRYRQRHYGEQGTMVIWEALTDRVDDVQLPVDGDLADFLWQSFVDLGFKREIVMVEVAEYARALWSQTGNRWPKLYERIVGGFIERGMIDRAEEWHRKLQDPHLASPNDILHVLRPDVSARHSNNTVVSINKAKDQGQGFLPSLVAFRNICRSIQGHQIYVPTMSALLQNDLPAQELVLMHLFLVGKGDHPRSYKEIEPLIHGAEKRGLQSFRQKLRAYVDRQFPSEVEDVQIKDSEIENSEHRLPANPGEREFLHDQKPIKDDLGARIFATDALKFELILSGFKMFGATSIGPQSLREMAVRAHGSRDLLERLRLLQEAGISIGDSIFSRLVRKLATENRGIVLADLLRSDQHPDMLEDTRVQESLLLSHYLSRDWRRYNLTLAILSEIADEGPNMFNIHFRKHLRAGEWELASKVVDELALRGEPLTKTSIDLMIKHVLTPRRPGSGPIRAPGRPPQIEVAFVFRVLQRTIPLGSTVSARLWIELIKRLGQTDSWVELRRCCFWLARHYSFTGPQKDTPLDIISKSSAAPHCRTSPVSEQNADMLRTIFNRHVQEALVHWGFRKRVSPNIHRYHTASDPIPWVRGLAFLRELERSGVELQVSCISRACRQRLAIVFGRNRRSSRPMNRLLRRENPYTLEKVLGDISRVWGEPSLFAGREHIDVFRLINPPSSKMSYRRTRKTLWRKQKLRGPAFTQSRS